MALCLFLVIVVVGCDRRSNSSAIPEPVDLPEVQALRDFVDDLGNGFILARGQIEPLGGVIGVIGPVGDRVQSIDVKVGDIVDIDQAVGRLAGQAIREAELDVARIQLEEGEARLAAEQAAGKAKLDAAQIGVKTQQLKLEEAQAEKSRASQDRGALTLLRSKVALEQAMLEKLQAASSQSTSPPLVSRTAVQQQELVVQAAEAEYQSVERQLDAAIEAAQLLLDSAQQEAVAIERSLQSSQAAVSIRSLRKKVELLEMQAALASLKSPIPGSVVAVDANVGQSTTGLPIVRIANLSTMICRAEISAIDRFAIEEGARAAITGGGFQRPLRGVVRAMGTLLAAPRLPNAMPGTRNDWSAFQIEIEIDAQDREYASQLLHAQVDVAIESKQP